MSHESSDDPLPGEGVVDVQVVQPQAALTHHRGESEEIDDVGRGTAGDEDDQGARRGARRTIILSVALTSGFSNSAIG